MVFKDTFRHVAGSHRTKEVEELFLFKAVMKTMTLPSLEQSKCRQKKVTGPRSLLIPKIIMIVNALNRRVFLLKC